MVFSTTCTCGSNTAYKDKEIDHLNNVLPTVFSTTCTCGTSTTSTTRTSTTLWMCCFCGVCIIFETSGP